jgi:DNA-binding transcriptional LysR family regulator
MLGTSSTLRFGITTRSRASSRAWVGSTIGSWVRGSKACLDCPAARFRRSDRVGDVLRTDDPLAGRASLLLADLADRPWFQLPDGTDPIRRDYWNGATSVGERPAGPVVRTVNECLQAVLWNGTVGIAPLTHALPDGLTWAPLDDMSPSPSSSPG